MKSSSRLQRPKAPVTSGESAAVKESGTKRKRTTLRPAADTPALATVEPVVAPRKHRVLVFGTRGTTARFRHLMSDVRALLPHHKKESKLDAKDSLSAVNEIADALSCDTTIFFEVRKKRDLYLWFSKTPAGPSVKFHVVNVHTMDELRLTGNCLKGSRPILSFDRSLDDADAAPHLRLIRELLAHAFSVPKGHPKSQPFNDHVLNFGYADGKVRSTATVLRSPVRLETTQDYRLLQIWLRHYQVVDKASDVKAAARLVAAGEQSTVLVEIGPRFVLEPIRIFAGSMGGATIWSSPTYVSPSRILHELHSRKSAEYSQRVRATAERRERSSELVMPQDPLSDVFK
jgi:ribosome biogenesis protein BRX1